MVEKYKDGGPAFPVPKESDGGWEDTDCTTWRHFHGMTLRDWFAGQAVAGIMGSSADAVTKNEQATFIATEAYLVADAMLKAREQQ